MQSIQEVPRAKGLCIGLTLFIGEHKQILQENTAVQGITVTNRIGFPEVNMPGFSRHDFYLTLEEGDFSQDRKNIEVTLHVRKDNGEQLKVNIHFSLCN